MKPVYQTIFTVPGGNCFQAAVASLFEMELGDVPDFCSLYDDGTWWMEFQRWCMGFALLPLYLSPEGLEPKDFIGFTLAFGKTEQGHDHTVIYADGELIHDPIPGGKGLAEVIGYGVFISPMWRPNAHRRPA